MKKFFMYIFFIIVFIIVIFRPIGKTRISDIDSCLDKGYCWDYIRNRCEQNNQGFCIKNSQECFDRNGLWEKEKQYCRFTDYNVNAAK